MCEQRTDEVREETEGMVLGANDRLKKGVTSLQQPKGIWVNVSILKILEIEAQVFPANQGLAWG